MYVKTGIPCKRRADLELINIECLWVEINVRNKKVLERHILYIDRQTHIHRFGRT